MRGRHRERFAQLVQLHKVNIVTGTLETCFTFLLMFPGEVSNRPGPDLQDLRLRSQTFEFIIQIRLKYIINYKVYYINFSLTYCLLIEIK